MVGVSMLKTERISRSGPKLSDAQTRNFEAIKHNALAYLGFPSVALEAPARQQCAGEDQPRDRAQVAHRAGVPLHGLAGADMRGQDEIWQESGHFSGARMNEPYDDGRTRGIDGPVE